MSQHPKPTEDTNQPTGKEIQTTNRWNEWIKRKNLPRCAVQVGSAWGGQIGKLVMDLFYSVMLTHSIRASALFSHLFRLLLGRCGQISSLVRLFIQRQKVKVTHQHGAKVKMAFLASTQLMLFLWSKKEIVQECETQSF